MDAAGMEAVDTQWAALEVSTNGYYAWRKRPESLGHEISREIAPGPHRLRVHNTLFWKNIDFTVAVSCPFFVIVVR